MKTYGLDEAKKNPMAYRMLVNGRLRRDTVLLDWLFRMLVNFRTVRQIEYGLYEDTIRRRG